MTSERTTIKRFFKQLLARESRAFPDKGKPLSVPCTHGVYIIRKGRSVLHVGRTLRARNGLRQRLSNHLCGQSSFTKKYLKGESKTLRKGHTYQYLEVESSRQRALLESYAVGSLCPKHLGLRRWCCSRQTADHWGRKFR